MNNPVQWFYLCIVALAVILPALILGIAKPLRLSGPGWQKLSWGLAVAIPFGVGGCMTAGILGSGGDLRGTRLESLNDALRAMGPIPLLVLFVGVIVGTVVLAVWWRRRFELPDPIDAPTLRRLVRRDVDYDQLLARYGSGGQFTTAELRLAGSLGLADREARRLSSTIISYVPRYVRGHYKVRREALVLEDAVRSARALDDARRTIAEMRSLMARLQSGNHVRL